jgi:hypothetical protein
MEKILKQMKPAANKYQKPWDILDFIPISDIMGTLNTIFK